MNLKDESATVCFPDITSSVHLGVDNPARIDIKSLLQAYKTDSKSGIESETAKERLQRFGANETEYRQHVSSGELIIRQLKSSVVILLLVAAVISFCTQDYLQAAGILVAVLINTAVGFFIESKAQVSLDTLANLTGPSARVLRGGKDLHLPARELVPGDIVLLSAGMRVPADLRLIESASLRMDESVLTGESLPVDKSAEPIKGEEDNHTLALHGTHVLHGRGKGVVIATGKSTTLGRLQCCLMEGHAAPTPLENRLEELGKEMSLLTLAVCVIIAALGLFYRYDIWTMLDAGIALAVAAIPEGLPVVATLALAIGMLRMVRAGALIRQIAAVETLGCTTVICVDKTGTLTENKLLVTEVITDERHITFDGQGYEPDGNIRHNGNLFDCASDEALSLLLKAAVLCNDARLDKDASDGVWRIKGDPTEGALLVAGEKSGLRASLLRRANARIFEMPFTITSKRMATVHKSKEGELTAYIKGSPEEVIRDSQLLLTAKGIESFTAELKDKYIKLNSELADRGLRVLAMAFKELDRDKSITPQEFGQNLTFLGLVGMKDVARQGVQRSIQQCKQAGIKVMMLTGDQPRTALSIARELGIAEGEQVSDVLTGADVEKIEDTILARKLKDTRVLARVTPDIKQKIVRALQIGGNVVAMTGDGVNDAPALQQSDIGVAMGLSGTDLAREAANMVITDDNFSTIIKAIKQGRIIYDNIKRSICYLLTATVASVITVAGAMLSSGVLAMTPLQMLWLNLIMHVFPGLGIVLQGAQPGIMERKPRSPKEKIIGSFERNQILYRSILISASVLFATSLYKYLNAGGPAFASIAFATISLALLYQAWSWLDLGKYANRDQERAPINQFMYWMMAISYALVLVALYLPGLRIVLGTRPLSMTDFGISFGAATASWLLSEVIERLRQIVGSGRLAKTVSLTAKEKNYESPDCH